MSVSLSEERDRIQRQVEELEQSLSVTHPDLQLLSSETDDGSGSDETEEDGSQLGAGLLAQREKIQRQIQNLEDVLGPTSPGLVSGDDSSSDESEVDLSPSVDSCLQMNLVYQQVVQETLDQLETLLTHNHRQQKELVSQLSGPIKEPPREQTTPSSYQLPITMYLGRFLKPYFKDKLTGLGPPANQETKDKTSRMTGCLDDKKVKVKRWESWQKTLLIHSVSRDSLRRLIQPKLSRVDYLSQKLSSAGETDKQQLREQIDSLEKEMEVLRGKKEEELIGGRYEEHDWQKISNIDFEGTRDAEDIRCFWQNFLHPSINKSGWSQEEVRQLGDVSRRLGDRRWETIAEELGTGRTAFMCLQTFQRFVSDSLRHCTWTPAEDAVLRELVDKMRIGNFIPYTQISYFMDGRDPAQLIYRWNQVLDPRLKKGLWTKEEDQLLLRAVSHHGEKNWWKIRLEVPGRTDSGCRDRYYDCLKAGTKRGAFDRQERELLLQLVEKHGVGRWSKIAAEIPHRYDAQCLRAWRKLSRQLAPPPQKRSRAKNPPGGPGGEKRRRRARRKVIKVEEEEESSEQELEEVLVEYMDSDNEEKKKEVENGEGVEEEEEEQQQEEEEEEEYTFPPMNEWIPSEEQDSFLSFHPVALPSSSSSSSHGLSTSSERSTIVGQFGRSVTVGPPPRTLQWAERHRSSSLMMVSAQQLRAHLCRREARGRSFQLQAAVTPWIGNLLIPTRNRMWSADALREGGERSRLSSTPVFLLLLQTMNVDTAGCKDMIEKRKRKEVLLTPPPCSSSVRRKDPRSVAGLLQQREEQKELERQQHLILEQLERQRRAPPQVMFLRPPRGTPEATVTMAVNQRTDCPQTFVLRPQFFTPNLQLVQPAPQPAPSSLIPPPVRLSVPPVSGDTTSSANRHTVSSTEASHGDHDYIQSSPASKETIPESKKQCGGRKRGRREELVGGAVTGVTQERKRTRKPSQKAIELQECNGLKKKRTSSAPSKQEVAVKPGTRLPGMNLLPGQSMWLMTPGGLVQLVEAPPQGLHLVQSPYIPPPPAPPFGFPSDVQKAVNPHTLIRPRPLPLPLTHSSKPLPFVLQHGRSVSCPPQPPLNIVLPYKGVVRVDKATPPSLRREALQFDPSLMFLEPRNAVRDWLGGRGGVSVPGVGVALPYLPPFTSNLSTLSALLRAKEALTKSSLQLLTQGSEPHRSRPKTRLGRSKKTGSEQNRPEQPDSTSDPTPAAPSDLSCDKVATEAELVSAVRELVTERFSGNPAYQLLKARFLSCFTVPALLATIQPMTEKPVSCSAPQDEKAEEDEEEEAELKTIKDMGRRRRAEKSLLLCDMSGAPANHFSGILHANTPTSDQTRPDR